MNTPNDNIEQKAREWYAKEYPLTSATSNRQLCEEDVVMCAAFARSLTQPKEGLSDAERVNGLTPEEAYKCWGDAEYNWPRLPTPRPPWTEYFLQLLRERAHFLSAHSDVGKDEVRYCKKCRGACRYNFKPRPTEQP